MGAHSSCFDKIMIDGDALYHAIKKREGATLLLEDLPIVERRQRTKVLYLERDSHDSLVIKKKATCKEECFLKADSGELLHMDNMAISDLGIAMVQDDRWMLGTHQYPVALSSEILEGEAVPLDSRLLRKRGFKKDDLRGEMRSKDLRCIAKCVGTRHLLFSTTSKEGVFYSTPLEDLITYVEKAEHNKSELPVPLYEHYKVTARYSANVRRVMMPYDRTFIIGPNTENTDLIEVLGGGAENNRLAHYDGTIVCGLSYLERLPGVRVIEKGEELIMAMQQQVPSKKREIPRFENLLTYETHPLSAMIPYMLLAMQNRKFPLMPPPPLLIDNAMLGVALRDLIGMVLLMNNISYEPIAVRQFKQRQFIVKYFGEPQAMLLDGVLQVKPVLRQLINHTVSIFLPLEMTPPWAFVVGGSGSVMNDELVVHFVKLLDKLARHYLDASQCDALARALYKHSFINLTTSMPILRGVTHLFDELRKTRYSKARLPVTTTNNVESASETRLAVISKQIRPYYEIILMGETNGLYRDTLYYMANPESDKSDELVMDMRTYRHMRIYTGSESAYRELVRPVFKLTSQLVNLGKEGEQQEKNAKNAPLPLSLSNNIKGLMIQLIYYAHYFIESEETCDFVAFSRCYTRLYALMRLLPVTQLQNAWLHRLYAKTLGLYLYVCDRFIEAAVETAKMEGYASPHDSRGGGTRPLDVVFPYKDWKRALWHNARGAASTVATIQEKIHRILTI